MCPEYDKLCRAHQQPQNTEAVQPFIAHWKQEISILICLEKKKSLRTFVDREKSDFRCRLLWLYDVRATQNAFFHELDIAEPWR